MGGTIPFEKYVLDIAGFRHIVSNGAFVSQGGGAGDFAALELTPSNTQLIVTHIENLGTDCMAGHLASTGLDASNIAVTIDSGFSFFDTEVSRVTAERGLSNTQRLAVEGYRIEANRGFDVFLPVPAGRRFYLEAVGAAASLNTYVYWLELHK